MDSYYFSSMFNSCNIFPQVLNIVAQHKENNPTEAKPLISAFGAPSKQAGASPAGTVSTVASEADFYA